MANKKNSVSSVVKKFYTVTEFHELVGDVVSKAQVYRMIRKGDIPVKYIGQKVLIPAVWVDNFLDDSAYTQNPGM